MAIYAVIDTNVLVSAMLSKKDDVATAKVIDRTLDGQITPLYSDAIISEYREVLSRKKFGFDREMVRYLLAAIEKYGIRVEPSPSGVVLPDLKDVPFYEIVMEKRSDDAYLVTGNLKHFPKEPYIVTPREMIEIMDK